MTKKQPTAWDKRKRRVLGQDPEDPSLALSGGEWVVDAKGVRHWVEKPKSQT